MPPEMKVPGAMLLHRGPGAVSTPVKEYRHAQESATPSNPQSIAFRLVHSDIRWQPWQIRHLARRHRLPIRMAATIGEIIGMGGVHER